jgi:hypothetical protein
MDTKFSISMLQTDKDLKADMSGEARNKEIEANRILNKIIEETCK